MAARAWFLFRMSESSSITRLATAQAIEKYLACPETHHPLVAQGESISCSSCNFKGTIRDDVAVMLDGNQPSFFDDTFEVMRQELLERGASWRIACERQVALLQDHLKPGQIILDVGCGPCLPYQHPSEAFVIGLEPSLPSIRENKQVNLGVCGTSTSIPLGDYSVDLAVAFYSIHHMVGRTIAENDQIVRKAFSELARVIRPGGTLFVFEMTPWRVFAALQYVLWNQVRRLLGRKMDMYFRSRQSMLALGSEAFPGATLEVIEFGNSPFQTFPPIFSLPWFRLPKLLYPLEARGYKWRLPSVMGPT
jgi:SAM-dependent methyltransferase